MGQQLHKRLTTEEVIEVLEKYLSSEIEVEMGLRLLNIKRRQWFKLLKNYRENPDQFTITYQRSQVTRKLDPRVEKALAKELKKEKQLIDDKATAIKRYNYSYVQQRLEEKYDLHVSLPTIIDRAKKTVITSRS